MKENLVNSDTQAVVSSDARLMQLESWLENQGYKNFTLLPASQDASFRRYFRLTHKAQESLIVMDAPPKKESLSPFIEIAQSWYQANIAVPQIYEYSRDLGFLVLEDFGHRVLLNELQPDNLMQYYCLAIDELINLQKYSAKADLPKYTANLLHTEMMLFSDWFLVKHCGLQLSEQETQELKTCFEYLSESALQQTQVSVHRDYHSRNLMLKSDESIGVIDFQDAVEGPLTYDLVSLLKDCYIKLVPEQRNSLLAYYYQNALEQKTLLLDDKESFKKAFDLMGAQRHLKAIGIFCRLYHRDGKANYLADIPRTASYLQDLIKDYAELKPLIVLLETCLQEFNLKPEVQE